MTVKTLVEYFDNWDVTLVINNSELGVVYKNNIRKFWNEKNPILLQKIDSFGIYDNELCVRICGANK